jgi:hypothetical protein
MGQYISYLYTLRKSVIQLRDNLIEFGKLTKLVR